MAGTGVYELIPPGSGEAIPLPGGRNMAGSGPGVAVHLEGPLMEPEHLVFTVTGDRVFCQARAAGLRVQGNGQPGVRPVLAPGAGPGPMTGPGWWGGFSRSCVVWRYSP